MKTNDADDLYPADIAGVMDCICRCLTDETRGVEGAVIESGDKGEKGKWELYNIATDRAELHDLAAKHADQVGALSAQWEAWAKRANVLPLGAWRGKRKP